MLNYDTPVRLVDRSIYSDVISTMNCDIPDCEEGANAYLKFVFIQSGGYSALSVRDICLEHYQWLMAVGTQELRQIPNPNEEKGFKACLELLVVLGDTYWEEIIYCAGDIAAYLATVRVPGQHTSKFFVVLCEAHKNAMFAKTETAQTGGNDD